MPTRIQRETSLTPRTCRQYSLGYAQRTDRRDQRHPGVPTFGPDSLKSARAAASVRSDAIDCAPAASRGRGGRGVPG